MEIYTFLTITIVKSYAHGKSFLLFQTQVEVALAAADGDINVAVEILMSQQV